MKEENRTKMKKENWVVKANKLIEAKGRLGIIEQKLFASLVSEIKPEDKDFKPYKLEVKEIAKLMNLSSKAVYDQIKTAARNLRKKEIMIENVDEKGKRSFLVTGLLSSARYKEGEGYLEVYIDPNLKPYLLNIVGEKTPFTKHMIENILKLDSSYSARIYELLKQYEKVRKREFEIDEIREMLGIAENEYKRFYDFERYVLKVAKTEINEKTDIWIDYEKIKRGRRVAKIVFEIEPKLSGEKEIKPIDYYTDEEIQDIRNKCGLNNSYFNKEQVLDLYMIAANVLKNLDNPNKNPYEYIRFYYNELSNKENIKNKFDYLKNLLENDYCNFANQITLREFLGRVNES